jgi:hypothetical protein
MSHERWAESEEDISGKAPEEFDWAPRGLLMLKALSIESPLIMGGPGVVLTSWMIQDWSDSRVSDQDQHRQIVQPDHKRTNQKCNCRQVQ